MSDKISKLLEIASDGLSEAAPLLDPEMRKQCGPVADELLVMLSRKNGFYALEKALHVFPAQSTETEIGLDEWNSRDLWIKEFQGMADGCLFFAEDVFGYPFGIKEDGVHTFDPETGNFEKLADTLEQWATSILDDYDFLTGYTLAHDWQAVHGEIPANKRLIPKIPFMMEESEYTLDNLYVGDCVEGMKFRGSLANQIKDLPPGAEIKLEIVD